MGMGMGGPDVLAALIEVVIISGHVWGWDGDGMGGPDVLTALVEAVIIVALCGDGMGMGMGWDGMGWVALISLQH